MEWNIIIILFTIFAINMECSFDSLAHTHPLKMERLNEKYDQLTTSFAYYSPMLLYHPLSSIMSYKWPPTFLAFSLPKTKITPHPPSSSIINTHLIHIFVLLDVFAILLSYLLPFTN